MGEGADKLTRSRIPEFRGFVRARRQDSSAVRTKRCMPDAILVGKGEDELGRGCIPELGGFVPARR